MAAPQIVPRSAWGGTGSRSGNVNLAAVRYYVVHYPVMTSRPNNQWARQIEAMHRANGWGMIGYNYLVFQDGQVLEGSGRIRGIHSPARNSDGWGVCHCLPTNAQGVALERISEAMKRSSVALYNWLGSLSGRQLIKWWHGRDWATSCPGPDLRAWVQAGMPATGGAPGQPPAPPPEPEDEQMVSFLPNAGGQTLVFAVSQDRRWVGVTWQSPGQNWHGQGRGGAGWPAGMVPFAAAPTGHRITGITSGVSTSGAAHVIIRTDRAETYVTWQERGGGWVGRGGGYHAGFRHFAARP